MDDQLTRLRYESIYDNSESEAFVYLPRGYTENIENKWPIILFLHGNGERGNAKDELEFVIMHGPLYEAWVQKKDLPFIIISPQLPMFGKDKEADYLKNRDKKSIPKREENGVPKRFDRFSTPYLMAGAIFNENDKHILPEVGWEERIDDVMLILNSVITKYNVDTNKIYLTGLSYGGFGTWFIASKYPQKFAAIAPVVGWGHPDFMKPIAENQLPVWAFAGGRDLVVKTKYFFKGMNDLEKLGHQNVRFTVHEDMGHDAWTRVYAGDDLYNWFLEHSKR